MKSSIENNPKIIKQGFPRHATIHVIFNYVNFFYTNNCHNSINFVWWSKVSGKSDSTDHFTWSSTENNQKIIRQAFPRHAIIHVFSIMSSFFPPKNCHNSINFVWWSKVSGKSDSTNHFTCSSIENNQKIIKPGFPHHATIHVWQVDIAYCKYYPMVDLYSIRLNVVCQWYLCSRYWCIHCQQDPTISALFCCSIWFVENSVTMKGDCLSILQMYLLESYYFWSVGVQQ